jgi:hypothetical protein
MRIFKVAWFVRFARAEGITDKYVLTLSDAELAALLVQGSIEEVSLDQ